MRDSRRSSQRAHDFDQYLTFERTPHINVHPEKRPPQLDTITPRGRQMDELRQEAKEIKSAREITKRDKRIEELEGHVDHLLESADAYSTQFISYTKVLWRELVENNLKILKLKNSVEALMENNLRISQFSEKHFRALKGDSQQELAEEIEIGRKIASIIGDDLEGIMTVVKKNEQSAIKLKGFTEKKITSVTQEEKRKLRESRSPKLKASPKEEIRKSDDEVRLLMKYGGGIQEKDEIESLKRDLEECLRAIDKKDRVIEKLRKQIKGTEELLEEQLQRNVGQSVQSNGLKNTALKLVEMQKRIDQREHEQELLENQVATLLQEKEALQNQYSQLQRRSVGLAQNTNTEGQLK